MDERSRCDATNCRLDLAGHRPLRIVVVEADPVGWGGQVLEQATCLDHVDRYDAIEAAALPIAACLPDIALVVFDPQLTSPDHLVGLARRAPTTMLAAITPDVPSIRPALIAAGVFSWYGPSTAQLACALADDHELFRRSSRGLTVLAPVASRVPALAAAS